MKSISRVWAILLAFAVASPAFSQETPGAPQPEGERRGERRRDATGERRLGGQREGMTREGAPWTPLFNGKDLTGWEVMGGQKDAFFVEDGVLACNGTGGDWIRSASEFGDFALRLEYKISPGGNSGVFIHSAREGTPWKTGFEVQIVDCYNLGINKPDVHSTGAIYDVLTPMLNPVRPAEEWNQMEITCIGPIVRVVLNGIKIIDGDFSQLTTKIGKYDGPYSELSRNGYIGFQDHNSPVWFRNIEARKLRTMGGR